jgi:hypothetical protein
MRDVSKDYDKRWQEELRAVGMAVALLDRAAAPTNGEELELLEVRAKMDADGGTSVLIILKAQRGSEKLVGFVGGLSLTTALLATAKKLRADGIRWREDRPWGQ